jgi:GTPase SAR1 family protein
VSVPAESKGTLSSLLVAPDKALSELVTAEPPTGGAAEGIKILICGPGGIGKSALYRKILADEIHRYKTGTTCRIPVLCTPGKKPWREVLHDAVGFQALPLELLDVQLEAKTSRSSSTGSRRRTSVSTSSPSS